MRFIKHFICHFSVSFARLMMIHIWLNTTAIIGRPFVFPVMIDFTTSAPNVTMAERNTAQNIDSIKHVIILRLQLVLLYLGYS